MRKLWLVGAVLAVAAGLSAAGWAQVTLFHERGAPTAALLLVIYGASHVYLLRQMALESGAFRIEDASAYLK